MNPNLRLAARKLRLSGLLVSLELRLQEASSHQLPHAQFLELVLQDELNTRQERLIQRRKKVAGFREFKTLEDFDWTFNPTIKRGPIYELATCGFIRQRRDVLLVGPPGLGKSHLGQALGYQAIKAGFSVRYCSIFDLVRELQAERSPAEMDRTLDGYLKVDLLLIDDMGLKTLPPKAGEALLELMMRRYENRSTLMTSNRPIEEWGKLFNDVPAATAILDRFLHHAEIIQMTGRSYRLHHRLLDQNKEALEKTQNTDPVPLQSTESLKTKRPKR
ncbi:MAG TPA: IS21-like element helper ATPase IstB [Anaerolineales bacterium]|jgi:DNA replication protein DnaC|nr:IS21-like element helper ATPase IstB [Anaerolineales bacterium]